MRFSKEFEKEKIERVFNLIKEADYVLIGAGSGLSTAAGIDYGGEEFRRDFKPFIEKYGFTDLYTSSFYDFKSQEEYWAYWAKHIAFANTHRDGLPLYQNIYKVIKEKDYFVITTNVDDQFYKTGFDKDRIFRVQGSYRMIQCTKACHDKLYDDKDMVDKMLENIDSDLKVKSELVPVCPVCGEAMEPNLRKDGYFVQDSLWYQQNEKYEEFLKKAKDKKVVLLEFGVGFNTPGIIRFPFEQLTSINKNWTLVRFNRESRCMYGLTEEQFIPIYEDLVNIWGHSLNVQK